LLIIIYDILQMRTLGSIISVISHATLFYGAI